MGDATEAAADARASDAEPAATVVPLRADQPDNGEDDSELVARACRGDIAAFESLVRRHQATAYRTAALIAGIDEAEDVAQEAFLKAFRHLPRFQSGSPFRPWLLAIVANEARNRRRSGGRYLAALRRVAGQRLLDGLPADERAVGLERRQLLLTTLATLPERERLVVHCRYLLEFSEAETAQVLGIPVGTVKSRLARGIARLRERLPVQPESREDRS